MDIEEHHLKLNGNDSKSLDNEINQKYKRIEINEKEHKKEEGKTQSLFYLEYKELIDWITRLWDNLKKNQIFISFMIILMILIYWIFKVNILLFSFYIISLLWNSFNIFPYIRILSFTALLSKTTFSVISVRNFQDNSIICSEVSFSLEREEFLLEYPPTTVSPLEL